MIDVTLVMDDAEVTIPAKEATVKEELDGPLLMKTEFIFTCPNLVAGDIFGPSDPSPPTGSNDTATDQ